MGLKTSSPLGFAWQSESFRHLIGDVCLDTVLHHVFTHLEEWGRFLDAAFLPGDESERPANLHRLAPPLQVFSLPGVGEARLEAHQGGVAFQVHPTDATFCMFADLSHLSYEAGVFALCLIQVGAGDVFRAMPEEAFAKDQPSAHLPFHLLNAILDRLAESQDQMPSADFTHLKEFFLTLLTTVTSSGTC